MGVPETGAVPRRSRGGPSDLRPSLKCVPASAHPLVPWGSDGAEQRCKRQRSGRSAVASVARRSRYARPEATRQGWKPGAQGGIESFYEGGVDRTLSRSQPQHTALRAAPESTGWHLTQVELSLADEMILNTRSVFTCLFQPVGKRALINLEGHDKSWEGQPKISSVRISVTTLRSVFTPYTACRAIGAHQIPGARGPVSGQPAGKRRPRRPATGAGRSPDSSCWHGH